MLLLFDIDGTLVKGASQAHATALLEALHNIHGIDVDGIRLAGSAAGRTDGELARMYLLEAGVSADRIDARADEVREECCRLYAGLCPADLSALVVPGMANLLESLSARCDMTLSLVTGNFEPVARVKLKAAGIGHWFARGQGGFGSDSEDRTMLPPIARRRAGELAGLTTSWPRERTVVIGDTPRDIACAHADGLRCIAVTTGPHTRDDLAGADQVVDSTAELGEALEALSAAASA
jgi:phosphoglycolate phosphatase-like HAD superfamily hydrolase